MYIRNQYKEPKIAFNFRISHGIERLESELKTCYENLLLNIDFPFKFGAYPKLKQRHWVSLNSLMLRQIKNICSEMFGLQA